MTNGELYEIAGRAAALRGYINRRRKLRNEDPLVYGSEIEAMMGWDLDFGEEVCRKCGHPANEEDILNDE